ncbi:MAG: chromate transporter [Bacillota bacterium]
MITRLFVSFVKLGAAAFGGGYAIIPLLEQELVHLRHWLTQSQFMDVVAISQMTPGPIAINAATFVGFTRGGFWGALAATTAVILPSIVIVTVLACLVLRRADSAWLQVVFACLRPLVVALVVLAALSVTKESLSDWRSVAVALATVLLVGRLKVNPLLALALSGLVGVLLF